MSTALKSVAVTAFAAQTLEGETWQGMCRWAVNAIANGKTITSMYEEMSVVERQMKADYDVSAMPSAWRSAKSVVLGAVREDIILIQAGKVVGKTEIETQIKVKRIAADAPRTIVGRYARLAEETRRMWNDLTDTEKETVPTNLRWTNL